MLHGISACNNEGHVLVVPQMLVTFCYSEFASTLQIMDTWIRQKGYPVLNLERTEDGDAYVVTQERFLTDPEAYDNVSRVSTRLHPIRVVNSPRSIRRPRSRPTTTSGRCRSPTSPRRRPRCRRSGCTWRTTAWRCERGRCCCRSYTVAKCCPLLSSSPIGSSWTKLNVDQLGYYRVNYPLDDWRAFVDLLMAAGGVQQELPFSVSDRAALINDAFRYEYAIRPGDSSRIF